MDLSNVGRFFGRNARKSLDHSVEAAQTLVVGVKDGWVDQTIAANAPQQPEEVIAVEVKRNQRTK